jgi:V/A-type H+/Na+-transporting ATPase subunit A
VGPDALPDAERLVLETTRMLREDFLQQNAYHDVDAFCPIIKQKEMLHIILEFNNMGKDALNNGVSIDEIAVMKIKAVIARLKEYDNNKFKDYAKDVLKQMEKEFVKLKGDSNE